MRPHPKLVLVALVALTVAGCASVSEPPPEVPFTIPERFTAPAGDAAATDLTPWWRSFGDPALDRLVDQTLELSPTLDAARARLRAAVGAARIAGAAARPQADLSLDGSRRRQNFIGLPIPGAEGSVLTNTSTTVGLALGAAWEIDLWGRLAAGEGAALARGDAAAAELAALRLSLIGQVAKGWFGWAEASRQVALAEETLANRERTRRQIEDRYRLGLRSSLDLRLAKAAEADATAQLALRRQNADRAARRLEVLLVRYPGGDSLPPPTDLAAPPPLPAVDQPAELVTQRPDLVAAERRLAAAGLDVRGARAALYPQLRLSGSLGRSAIELEDLIDSDFSVWSLAAGLLQPVFQGGRLRAAVDVAEAGRQEAAAAYLTAALTAFGEVETALAAERFLGQRLTALSDAVEQAIAARDLAEQRYRTGLTDYLSVLEAQRQATQSRSQLVAARRELLDARVDLHLALGGDHERAAGTRDIDTPSNPLPTAQSSAPSETES